MKSNTMNFNFPINLINLSQKKQNQNYKQNVWKQNQNTNMYMNMNNYSIGLSGMNKQPIQLTGTNSKYICSFFFKTRWSVHF